ncbi:transposase [Nitrospirillum amazonense]|uniref:Transposase n=1 Tax=Nitrospirillum amazonense TaxID=28077 RepID=A0A560EFQ7_9PROT|nr:IS110 family transposase [Nitrospirillum amazonense]TWB08198.1 transposase [Nitrospirillum amazonense]
MDYKRIAIDISKHVFTVHGVDPLDQAVLRRNLKRSDVEKFFRQVGATEVVMEACGSAHYWARVLEQLGHRVRLLPAQYVKPFVKRSKNDRTDAEAICEAASRPGMTGVPVKTAQQQADTMILRHRDLLIKQRTATINALRGHAAEFGVITGKGTSKVQPLLNKLAEDEMVPTVARGMFERMREHIDQLDQQIDDLEKELLALHQANKLSRSLAAMPGIGPIIAINYTLTVAPEHFKSGRHFAAWLGLTPKEHSTGGKQRLGRISKAGNERLRQLLIVGATSVIRHAKPGAKSASAWLLKLLERKPRKLVAVALANKMARILWAMMAHGEAYRHSPA